MLWRDNPKCCSRLGAVHNSCNRKTSFSRNRALASMPWSFSGATVLLSIYFPRGVVGFSRGCIWIAEGDYCYYCFACFRRLRRAVSSNIIKQVTVLMVWLDAGKQLLICCCAAAQMRFQISGFHNCRKLSVCQRWFRQFEFEADKYISNGLRT